MRREGGWERKEWRDGGWEEGKGSVQAFCLVLMSMPEVYFEDK